MNITKKQLTAHGFKHTHLIEINNNGIPVFKLINHIEHKASIYLWLGELANDEYEVLYVGKAGKGVARRFNQHMGGFTNSKAGRSNRELIEQYIKSGKRIVTFARISENYSCFGVQVPAYSTEEEAMCKAFEPLWNRARFPSDKEKSNRIEVIQDLAHQNTKLTMTCHLVEYDLTESVGLEEFKYHIDSICPKDKSTFNRVIEFIGSQKEFSNLPQKIVNGYSNQLPGYSNKPMLVITSVSEKGKAMTNAWALRIPLVSGKKITIILNQRYLKKDCPEAFVTKGKSGDFIPNDLFDFLNKPFQYLSLPA